MGIARNIARLVPNGSGLLPNANIEAVAASKLTGSVALATQVSGTLPDANAPSGSVIQVVSIVDTAHYTFSSGSAGQYTYYDVSGLSLSITPTSSSNKILLLAQITCGQPGNSYNAFFRFVRNSTPINIGINGSYGGTSSSGFRASDGSALGCLGLSFLDSPSTTSSTTYKIQICNSGGSAAYSYVNRPHNNSGWEQTGSCSFTVMEISA
jgi:hypothetical protein